MHLRTGRCSRTFGTTRAGEEDARKKALERWEANPEIDHLIGRKLSQKYRFAEGSARQKQALAMDPEYQPAKLQLCQDLLRLGEEAEGWKLAAEIFSKDGYNVVAYNLVTLRDRLAGFRTLEGEGLIVRMETREAESVRPARAGALEASQEDAGGEVRRRAERAGDRRGFSAAKGICGADVRSAWGRGTPGRLLRPGRHGQEPGVARRASLELGSRPLA